MLNKSQIGIVGGGPAGLVAACLLAQSGHIVTVFDHKIPWEKPCGGMFPPLCLKEFNWLCDSRLPTLICESIHYESPDGRQKTIQFKSPTKVISRYDLSQFLLDRAIAAGVILIKEKVVDLLERKNQIQIGTSKKEYIFQKIIGADGTKSIVRATFCQQYPQSEIGVTCGYSVKDTGITENIIKFFSGDRYIWLFPGPKHLSVGILTSRTTEKPRYLFNKINDVLEQYSIGSNQKTKWFAHIPRVQTAEFYLHPCSGKNWLLVGDAAGHVDPITGAGLYYAFKSAQLASEAIIENRIDLYDQRWQQSYGKQLVQKADHLNKINGLSEFLDPSTIGNIMFNNATHQSKA